MWVHGTAVVVVIVDVVGGGGVRLAVIFGAAAIAL